MKKLITMILTTLLIYSLLSCSNEVVVNSGETTITPSDYNSDQSNTIEPTGDLSSSTSSIDQVHEKKYLPFESTFFTVEIPMDEETYEHFSAEGKMLNNEGRISFNKPYFQDLPLFMNEGLEPLSLSSIEDNNKKERFLTIYACICDFFDTYDERIKFMSTKEIEEYVDAFNRAIRNECTVRVREDNFDLYRMSLNSFSYLFFNGYAVEKDMFRSKYTESWDELNRLCSIFDRVPDDFYLWADTLMKARDIYESSDGTAKEALEVLNGIQYS